MRTLFITHRSFSCF